METSVQLITAVRDIAGSDRKAAPLVGVSQTVFSNWRNGTDYPSDDKCVRVAQLLNLDPAYVTAAVRADRAKSQETRAMWQRVAATFAKAAGVAAVAIGAGLVAPQPAQAGFDKTLSVEHGGQYTLRPNRRRKAPRGSLGAFAVAVAQTLGLHQLRPF